MRLFFGAVVLCALVFPPSSPAEFYKYRDDQGVIRYTDNILEVPRDQQGRVETYTESRSPEEAGQPQKIETLSDVADRLKTEKVALAAEHEKLLAEQRQLEEAAKIERKTSENEAFEKMIIDYNLRLRQYEEKRRAFGEKVEAYNTMVDAQFK